MSLLPSWFRNVLNCSTTTQPAKMTGRQEVEAAQTQALIAELAKKLTSSTTLETEGPRLNWKRLSNGCYLVRTQAGFVQVLRDAYPGRTRKELRNGVSCWPKAYPAVVRINKGHGNYIPLKVLPLAEYIAQTQALIDELAGE